MPRIPNALRQYPRQFWLLLFGMLISTIGQSMIWPFLTVYLRERLNVSLATVTMLLMINSITSIISTFIAGPITDRFGRKWVMVISLAMMGLVYLIMSRATALPVFALLMAVRGAFTPLYKIGADAMIADLIPNHQRVEAYSLSRTANNVGFAIGPSLGGFLSASSFTITFFISSLSLFFFSAFTGLAMRETMPQRKIEDERPVEREVGYTQVFHDPYFLVFVLGFTFVGMASSLVFVLLSSYTTESFHMPAT